MKNTIILLSCLFLWASCGSDKNAEAFIGEWKDTKKPNQIWKIEKEFAGYKGTRIGAADFYKTDTETWKVKSNKKVLTLEPKSDKGSTLTYFPDKDQIIRFPPGTTYQRVQ